MTIQNPLYVPTGPGPGRPRGTTAWSRDFSIPMGDPSIPEEEIDRRIATTFRVFNRKVATVIAGHSRGMCVSGAFGTGKTVGALRLLTEAELNHQIRLKQQSVAISPVELYAELYQHKNKGDVLLVDDCDGIWDFEEGRSILKKALDSNDPRILQWAKNSAPLYTRGIPNEFEYNGTVIFLTNRDLAYEVEKNSTKSAKHIGAILSRITYLDLGIHTKRDCLIRIKQIVFDPSREFLRVNRLTDDQGKTMVEWIAKHLVDIRLPSLRTCIELGEMLRHDPDWEETAEVTLFKRS